MAVRKVIPSAAGTRKDTLIGQLVALVNAQAAALNALKGGAAASSIATQDTIAYRGINTPT